ncbi:MAG: hypothetical protein V4726_04415 [Verrucomicrobiota bacterium]
MRMFWTLFPVVSLRSTTGYRLFSLREKEVLKKWKAHGAQLIPCRTLLAGSLCGNRASSPAIQLE